MKIKSKIFKRKSGKSKGKWIARLEWFDEVEERKKSRELQADTRSAAVDKRNAETIRIQGTDGQVILGDRMTFDSLVAVSRKLFYKKADIAEGRKVAGVRSIGSANIYIDTLAQFFGKKKIRHITAESLKDYRLWRLKTGSRKPHLLKLKKFEPVKIATVNRELGVMRRMMRFAFARGWVVRDIFFGSDAIDKSAEMERTRVLSREEESRLLSVCSEVHQVSYKRTLRGKERQDRFTFTLSSHLKPMIILALDSAMRKGEIVKLRWSDVDFDQNFIRVIGSHTKTERERLVPLSDRARAELLSLKTDSPIEPFPFKDIKKSFNTAKDLAKIDDLHFHDLRRTALTRWQQQGVSIAFAGKAAGHTQLQTTAKYYTAAEVDTIQAINEGMNEYHSQNLNVENSSLQLPS